MKQKILSAIEHHSIITLFRHGHPDHDALGSQFGLKQWILDNYPDKQVYCLGDERNPNFEYPFNDVISDDIIESSLAIILDTAGINRVDDSRFMKAQMKIRIDHHPQFDEGYDLQLVYEEAGSCSEILAECMMEWKKKVSHETAEILMRGILADTLGFRTTNTTANTLRMAAFLAERDLDLPKLNRDVFDIPKSRFELATEFRKRAVIEACGLVTVVLTYQDCLDLGITSTSAKELVSQFGGVIDFEVWAIFAQTEQGTYEGSLRSKSVTVNDIACEFGGGGHKNACGIKGLSEQRMHELLNKIRERM